MLTQTQSPPDISGSQGKKTPKSKLSNGIRTDSYLCRNVSYPISLRRVLRFSNWFLYSFNLIYDFMMF